MRRRTFLAGLSAASIAPFVQAKGAPNPLLLPFTPLPAFDRYKASQFPEAFKQSMASYRAEIARIANQKAAPTFENTLAALEDSGREYNRVSVLFGVYTSTMNDKTVQAIETEWSPKFAAMTDEVVQNDKLFRRIEAVYKALHRDQGGTAVSPLDPPAKLRAEQQRLAWVYYHQFVLQGARLGPAQKKQLSEYNQKLASLYTKFSQNQLADEEEQKIVLESQDDLKGLPQSVVDSMAQDGKWVIRNTRSAMETFLTYSERRDLREKAFKLWSARGDMGGKTDNNKVVAEILRLRARRAKLLGFPTFAHWRLENSMAKTPEAAMKLMMQVWPAAKARVAEEVKDMQAIAGHEIEPWDYRFYAEKVRKAKYDLDENEIKPYFQLEKLKGGLFYMARQLYGFDFTKKKAPTLRDDIEVYEVTRQGHIGDWYFDPYARDGKSSGAWMNEYRTQENFKKPVAPIVSNNSNFAKASGGKPVLLSFDDAETMFHEFGHALHGLNSRAHYPMLAGTNVARDFVEFPSQMHENFLITPQVLNQFAIHAETGKPMPDELVAKIKRSSTFNQGFATTEFLASAILDMKLHLAGDVEIDPREFEKKALAELGMPKEIIMRHRIPHFGHLFSSDGYAAGYYSYLWSEVLAHDAYEAFEEAGNPYDPKVAKSFRENIMEVGNTLDPAQAYRNFRGRDATIDALLKGRGFSQ
ncbi:MAG: M3 family metallopeptidase [Candidatus Eremiobacteraeota bacterium]|nr:M3 family metallopeptidase [Candidatus Eremiobacteraeota bacterium]MCW5868922.1 M3 family metallopeptidase [Candidatus Eremiobacteraeota bacterium]